MAIFCWWDKKVYILSSSSPYHELCCSLDIYCICSASLCYHKILLGSNKALSLVRFLVDHIYQLCHPTKENQVHIFHLPAKDPRNIIFSLILFLDRKLTSHILNEIRKERKINLIFLILFCKNHTNCNHLTEWKAL